jgi:hypothetical protein
MLIDHLTDDSYWKNHNLFDSNNRKFSLFTNKNLSSTRLIINRHNLSRLPQNYWLLSDDQLCQYFKNHSKKNSRQFKYYPPV